MKDPVSNTPVDGNRVRYPALTSGFYIHTCTHKNMYSPTHIYTDTTNKIIYKATVTYRLAWTMNSESLGGQGTMCLQDKNDLIIGQNSFSRG